MSLSKKKKNPQERSHRQSLGLGLTISLKLSISSTKMSQLLDKAKNFVAEKVANIKKPEASINDVDFKRVSRDSVEYLAKVSVTNPYGHPIPICEISYTLKSAGRYVASFFFFISLLYHDLCFAFEFFFSFYVIDDVIEESWIFSFDLKRSSACMPFCMMDFFFGGFFVWFLSVYSICKFHRKYIYIRSHICGKRGFQFMW